MREIILYFAYKYFGDWKRIYDALETQENIDEEKFEEFKKNNNGKYITIFDNEYPNDLRRCSKPPFILFFKGNKELLLKRKKIWYFGSYYDKNFNIEISKHKMEFKENNIIQISGYSNDFEKSLLNNLKPKNMIIVRDSGINSYINMSKIEEELFLQKNLILTEYPGDVIPSFHIVSSLKHTQKYDTLVILSSNQRILNFYMTQKYEFSVI